MPLTVWKAEPQWDNKDKCRSTNNQVALTAGVQQIHTYVCSVLGSSVFTCVAEQGVLKCKMMLGTSLLTLTDFIPNTYVVREYSDKHLFQRQTGCVDGSVEQLAETLRI